jgi:O-methyltransferase
MLSAEVEGKIVNYNDIDDPYFISIFPLIKSHTLTARNGPVPLWVLYKSIEYIVENKIPGDNAECGVWNGGSMLLAALALIHFGDTSRKIYLYDTFAGMPRPDDIDKRWDGIPALPTWEGLTSAGKLWGFGGTVDMVRQVMQSSKYPEDKLLFVEGMVENTIPGQMAAQLSLLRLDTDLYSSTYHELVHLYPTLSAGGILIIDDYGFYQGSRAATDQYISEARLKVFLTRIDNSVRLVVKPQPARRRSLVGRLFGRR